MPTMSLSESISTWGEDQKVRLLRVRDYAVATVTQQPFRQSHRDQSTAPVTPVQSPAIASDTKICPACSLILTIMTDLIKEAHITGSMGSHHIAMDYTLHHLYISADLRCHMCSILYVSTLQYIRWGAPSAFDLVGEKMEDSWLYLTTVASRMEENLCVAMLGFVNANVVNSGGHPLSFIPADNSSPSMAKEVQPNLNAITSHTSGEATFKIIAEWLTTCRQTHPECRNTRPLEPGVPRRLLELRDTTVRVIDNTTAEPYACLSHCWGSQANVPHKLIEGGQYEPFEISALPRTLRDAIDITKRLGLAHIWIDCFCIVQNSREDWLEQSALMAQIYANSVFTIAALAAKDSHGGCYQGRNELALQPLHTNNLTLTHRSLGKLFGTEISDSRPEFSPLHTRAWVIQERLSSIRTISFGSLGVYWECRRMQASEAHTMAMNDVTENFKTITQNLQVAASRPPDETLGYPRSDFQMRWQHLVEIYTVCDLTYHSDRLIALSGITKDIEKHTGKKYVQGLWQDDMHNGLLWVHLYDFPGNNKDEISGRVGDSVFPSWSWASMRGKIEYFFARGRVVWTPYITVIDEGDKTSLHITTWKRPVTISEYDIDSFVLVDDGSGHGDLDEEYSWYHDEKDPANLPIEIVLIQRIITSENPYLGAVRCLVVAKSSDHAEFSNVYQRVGMTIIRFSSRREDPFPSTDPQVGKEENEVTLA